MLKKDGIYCEEDMSICQKVKTTKFIITIIFGTFQPGVAVHI